MAQASDPQMLYCLLQHLSNLYHKPLKVFQDTSNSLPRELADCRVYRIYVEFYRDGLSVKAKPRAQVGLQEHHTPAEDQPQVDRQEDQNPTDAPALARLRLEFTESTKGYSQAVLQYQPGLQKWEVIFLPEMPDDPFTPSNVINPFIFEAPSQFPVGQLAWLIHGVRLEAWSEGEKAQIKHEAGLSERQSDPKARKGGPVRGVFPLSESFGPLNLNIEPGAQTLGGYDSPDAAPDLWEYSRCFVRRVLSRLYMVEGLHWDVVDSKTIFDRMGDSYVHDRFGSENKEGSADLCWGEDDGEEESKVGPICEPQ